MVWVSFEVLLEPARPLMFPVGLRAVGLDSDTVLFRQFSQAAKQVEGKIRSVRWSDAYVKTICKKTPIIKQVNDKK